MLCTLGRADQLTSINSKLVLITKLKDAAPLTAGQSKHWKYPNDFQLMWNPDSIHRSWTENPNVKPCSSDWKIIFTQYLFVFIVSDTIHNYLNFKQAKKCVIFSQKLQSKIPRPVHRTCQQIKRQFLYLAAHSSQAKMTIEWTFGRTPYTN